MRGIAPRVLLDQVRSTAGWALHAQQRAGQSFCDALAQVDAAEQAWQLEPPGLAYFRMLLAAHFTTAATFVPTDVDARIRHHSFVSLDPEQLALACDVIDEAAGWDVRLVSARTVERARFGVLSGHDGEWLSVRAGALGRALALGAAATAQRLSEAVDQELERQRDLLAEIVREGDALDLLRAVTTIAHNLGDLSRVVEAWPGALASEPLRARYMRLGHAPGAFGDWFARVGALNRALMADENHRFLALRKPRALRASRELLLPIGPFFYGWGRAVATHPALEARDRAEVVAALLTIHLGYPAQLGCLRALAGIDAHLAGGLRAVEADLPARLRKELSSGPVRDALKTPEAAFEARLRKRARL